MYKRWDVIDLDKHKYHWVVCYFKNDDALGFDSFGVEYVIKDIKKLISNKNVKANTFRIQLLIQLCGYYWIC